MAIEFAVVEQAVFAGLRQGNQVLAELQREMSLDDVEKLMADTAEAVAYQQVVLLFSAPLLISSRRSRPCWQEK